MRVLIIDDSAVVRLVLAGLLDREGIETVTAADASIAARKLALRRPDVILLDLNLPGMDGLTFLRRLMRDDPIPVVVVSANPDAAMLALDAGALAVVTKPALDVRGFLEDSREMLIDAVRSAAAARLRPPAPAPFVPEPVARSGSPLELIALGASTGGPEALREIVAALPADSPPVVIAQHMPATFTAAFARRLGQESRLEVREAEDGLVLRPGLALVARGDRHLIVERQGARLLARLGDGPRESGHRPSVDVLFRSAARACGGAVAAALLTGMGDDGARGLLALRRAGAWTLAQDEATSVVYGMPKEAAEFGAACEVLPLGRIANLLAARTR